MTTTFQITAQGPFSLAESARFLCGFTPAAGSACVADGALRTAFLLDRAHVPVGVVLTQRDDVVHGVVTGTDDAAAAQRQVARILGLDVDGRGWAELGARDEAIGKLQAQWPGFRAVAFPSAYEAAVWGVLAQRIPMKTAANLKRRLAEQHGAIVHVDGTAIAVLPPPERLLAIDALPGLPDEKLRRLRGIAAAALDGWLDAERLRAMDEDHAIAKLELLRGVGPWTAAHVLYRGCAAVDALPAQEPRVLRGTAFVYGLPTTPTPAEFARIAASWRPFRMWVSILVVRMLAATPMWHGDEARGGRSKRRAA